MLALSAFLHENLYRSEALVRKLRDCQIIICGTGALGANICENLIRAGCAKLRIIDRDRVEERNLSTQPFQRTDIGAFKAKILANMIYRAMGVVIDARAEELTQKNAARLIERGAL